MSETITLRPAVRSQRCSCSAVTSALNRLSEVESQAITSPVGADQPRAIFVAAAARRVDPVCCVPRADQALPHSSSTVRRTAVIAAGSTPSELPSR